MEKEKKQNRPRVPWGLPLSGVLLLILGLVIGPVIRNNVTEEQLAQNVLLSATPFILVFVAILLFFISLIWLTASFLNNNIPRRIYRPIEIFAIGGILLSTIGLFQPWSFTVYRHSFVVLLFFTLFFILWSHVTPRGVRRQEKLSSMSVRDLERRDVQSGDET